MAFILLKIKISSFILPVSNRDRGRIMRAIKTYRIGETNINTQGCEMTIIAYRGSHDMDIQFEDGVIVTKAQYVSFRDGKISCKKRAMTMIDRVGETNIDAQGCEMTIIAYRGSHDMDIQFEDGVIVTKAQYVSFRDGKIRRTRKKRAMTMINRVGETNINTQGCKMTIIAYRGSHDIDIQFEDGVIVTEAQYVSFRDGKIRRTRKKRAMTMINRVGETNINTQGCKMTIIAYRGSRDIDIQFEDDIIMTKVCYSQFSSGKIKNRNKKFIYGKGYIGYGPYITSENGEILEVYCHWYSMMNRCYSNSKTGYEDCDVCNEWLNYQSFAKWYYENNYIIEDDLLSLDKDIKRKNNRVYSPDTCILIPQRLNMLVVNCRKLRGQYSLGVSYSNNKFVAHCSINKKQRHIGTFDTEEAAFYAYKKVKEAEIARAVDEYINIVPDHIRQIMKNYKIEITD